MGKIFDELISSGKDYEKKEIFKGKDGTSVFLSVVKNDNGQFNWGLENRKGGVIRYSFAFLNVTADRRIKALGFIKRKLNSEKAGDTSMLEKYLEKKDGVLG